MSGAKIQFSDKERELMTNADWILTKNAILQKTALVFTDWQAHYRDCLFRQAPTLFSIIQPFSYKISRGENYKGLPWMVLDYPRLFGQTDIFAIRTLFWWGRYITITLQLAGVWKERCEEPLCLSHPVLASNEFRISTTDDAWIHDQDPPFTTEINNLTLEAYTREIRKRNFLKISKIYPIEGMENLDRRMLADFEQLLKAAGY
ncbi:MAG: hypothetical protein JNN29_05185 [Chitinophagaceae bacterium]|nr:hypothetical protein [Chitinophagaceae bacterium]